MSSAERLIRYCKINTQSDPNSGTHPSANHEFNLAYLLCEELKQLGLSDASVDEHCYVYAHLKSNLGHPAKTVGFIAHMDTAPDFSGENVNPRIIENYDGNDIHLSDTMVTSIQQFPHMKAYKGKTLIVTDGTTLLGADDKAGVTAIMELLQDYHDHPEEPHGDIAVAFTPDEEIGQGAKFFDVKRMNADFAYTVDGDELSVFSDETFSAAAMEIKIHGFSIHPGEGKNTMKNAALIAAEFAASLPDYLTPAHTAGREGFIHLDEISGSCAEANLGYILRDHDKTKLEGYRRIVETTAAMFNARYGQGTIETSFEMSYENMKEVLKDHPEVSAIALRAIEDLGYVPETVAVRGGTDGSHISFMGLPCPNLGTGGGNFHGPYEYCVVEQLEDATRLLKRIAQLSAEEPL